MIAEDCGGGYVDVNVYDKGPVNRLVGSMRVELDPYKIGKAIDSGTRRAPHT